MNELDTQIKMTVNQLLSKKLTAACVEERLSAMGWQVDAGQILATIKKTQKAQRKIVLTGFLAAATIRPFLSQIHCVNSLDFMRKLPSYAIDLIITSPPYNVRKDYGDEVDDELPWPEYYAWMAEIIQECYRLLRTGGTLAIVVPEVIRWQREHKHNNTWEDFDSSYITHHQGGVVVGKGRIERIAVKLQETMRQCDTHLREPLTWVKGSELTHVPIATRHQMGSDSDPYHRPVKEMVLLGSKGQWHHRAGTGRRGSNALPYADDLKDAWWIPTTNSEHPAPFPIDIPRRLIAIYTHATNAIVYDPFAGSGTVQEAAAEIGLPWLGSEVVPKWAEFAQKRAANVENQGRLFWMPPQPKKAPIAVTQMSLLGM